MNSLKNMDEYQKEIMEIINEDKIKNKGIYHLYQNNVINQKKKMKSSIKYPSFNSLNHKGINNNLLNNNSNNSNNAPLMVFAPSLNNNIKKIKKVKGINETISLLKNTENTLYKIFLEKPKSINNNNKINFSDKKHINHLEIFSQNNTNKMWNNNNFSYLNNISNAANDYDSINKLAIKKSIINNKTDFLINNQKEINSFNRMIENYANHSNNNKGQKISKKKLNENKETIITNQVNEIVSTKQMSNESKTPSINSNTKNSKTIEKSDNMLDNISEISRKSTIMKDSKYYMNKSQRLIEYIKDYYNKNKKSYPETKINFYLYGRPIGQGAFGKVNLGLNVLTGRVVAIKSFKKRSEEKFKTNMKKVLYETDLMKRFNHPNITKILEVFHDEDYMLIIMEYINGGNLFSFVKKRRKLNEKMAKFLFVWSANWARRLWKS
jgi:hypothetical protein